MITIDAPHFCAAVVLTPGGIVTRAAPILKYMEGWTKERVFAYCRKKGWQASLRAHDGADKAIPPLHIIL